MRCASLFLTIASRIGSSDEEATGEYFQEALENNRIELSESPLTGEYLTSGGVKITLAAHGEYRWLEPDGSLVKGTYTVSAGTMSDTGYVLESDTGKLFTVSVELQTEGDLEPGQILPTVGISMLVFDEYDDETWRVTELLANVQFEAKRA